MRYMPYTIIYEEMQAKTNASNSVPKLSVIAVNELHENCRESLTSTLECVLNTEAVLVIDKSSSMASSREISTL